MSIDCRLVVILEDEFSPSFKDTFNQLIASYGRISGFTFVSGTSEDMTLKLTRPWADTIFNANEFLDFHTFTSGYMDRFQEIIFLKEDSIRTFRLETQDLELRLQG